MLLIKVSDSLFSEHELENFRTKLNKLKVEYFGGVGSGLGNKLYFTLLLKYFFQPYFWKKLTKRIPEDDDDVKDDMARTKEAGPSQKKSKMKYSHEVSSDDDSVDGERVSSDLWTPEHVIATWMEPGTTRNFVSFVLLLPSGLKVQECVVFLLEGVRKLSLSVKWPMPFTEVTVSFVNG